MSWLGSNRPFHSKMCCDNNVWTSQRDPQQKHLRKFSKYLQDQVWNAKKMQGLCMYNRSVQLKVLLKKLKCVIAPDKICMLRVQRSIILISAGAHLRSFGRCGKVAYICACRYVSVCLSRCAVIYVNVCVCVCPCAIYFTLLVFKGSENAMITSATLLKGWLALRVRKRRAMPI